MAYINKETAADIRNRLKEEFPAKFGWKFSVRIDSHIALRVAIVQSPMPFVAYVFDPYSSDTAMPKSALHARIMKRVRKQESGDVNHYWFREHYAPKTVAVLEKIIAIVMRDHWDKSDIQTDYFNCAWYQTFHIGKDWQNPLEYASPEKARAWFESHAWANLKIRADEIEESAA